MSSMRADSSSRCRPTSLQPTWVTPLPAIEAYTSRAFVSVMSSRVSMKMNSITTSPLQVVRQLGMIPVEHRRRTTDGRMGVRAAIWDGPGRMSVGTVPDARCAADGALRGVTACGICGTDVRTFYNGDRRISPPWVLGHEISGELIEIGSGAADEMAAA